MDSKKDKIVIDPDYVATNEALRIKEERDKEESQLTTEKLTKAINDIFDKELSMRDKQLVEVEEKIFKAQKLLHLVRYVLITSYYKKSNLEVPVEEENVTAGFDTQNRIHPAVKKLLGNNPSLDIFCSGKGKRRVATKNCDKNGAKSQASEAKRPKLDNKIETINSPVRNDQSFLKNRKKTRHRLIIGNVSKWVPSLEDNTTHKWMMYVRGEKDNPDISHIVEKVMFYLHPSYKPHDVVEVGESPFHLSRRGWGEFPLRVQIFFKCPINKPVSIVHNLKLEKTFTGRQTLGNETLVDVYLHDNSFVQKPATITKAPDELESEDGPNSSVNCIFNNFNFPLQQKHALESEFTPLDKMSIKLEPLDDDHSLQSKEINPKKHAFDSEFTPLDKMSIKLEHLDDEHSLQSKEMNPKLPIKYESMDEEQLIPSKEIQTNNESLELNADQTTANVDLISSRSDSAYGCSDTASMSFEHDYCDVIEEQFVENEVEMKDQFLNMFLLEHSYSVFSGTDNAYVNVVNQHTVKCHDTLTNENVDTKLIFGLGDGYLKETVPNVHNVVPKNSLIIQKPLEIPLVFSLNDHTDSRSILKSKLTITLPQNRFKNAGEALPYLLKRFTLWSSKVQNNSFKTLYPFIASSKEEFEKWPFGKKLNSEWNRARVIKKILGERFPSLKKWNTRAIFMYARSHRYSPITGSSNFLKCKSDEISLINECFSEVEKNAISVNKSLEVDISVDVESEADSTSSFFNKTTYIDISDNSLKPHCTFVKEAALDCGIILRSEEISDGVIMNGAERMMLEAVKCLAEGLVRRANHHSVCRKDYREGISEVTKKDVEVALQERSEMRSIKEFQAKKRQIEFFS